MFRRESTKPSVTKTDFLREPFDVRRELLPVGDLSSSESSSGGGSDDEDEEEEDFACDAALALRYARLVGGVDTKMLVEQTKVIEITATESDSGLKFVSTAAEVPILQKSKFVPSLKEILKQPKSKFVSNPAEIPMPQRSRVKNASYGGVSQEKLYKNFEPRDYPLRRHYDQPTPNPPQAQTPKTRHPIIPRPTGYL